MAGQEASGTLGAFMLKELVSISSNDAKLQALERRLTGQEAGAALTRQPSRILGSEGTPSSSAFAGLQASAQACDAQQGSVGPGQTSAPTAFFNQLQQHVSHNGLVHAQSAPISGQPMPHGTADGPATKRRRATTSPAAAQQQQQQQRMTPPAARTPLCDITPAPVELASAASGALDGTGPATLPQATTLQAGPAAAGPGLLTSAPSLASAASTGPSIPLPNRTAQAGLPFGAVLAAAGVPLPASRAAAAAAAPASAGAAAAPPVAIPGAPGASSAAAGSRSRKRKQSEPKHEPKHTLGVGVQDQAGAAAAEPPLALASHHVAGAGGEAGAAPPLPVPSPQPAGVARNLNPQFDGRSTPPGASSGHQNPHHQGRHHAGAGNGVPASTASAQKRSILSYYPQLVPGMTAALQDQNSRDSAPPSLRAAAAAAQQQQLPQPQLAALQQQAAMVPELQQQQQALQGEVERLRRELDAGRAELAGMRERCRAQEQQLAAQSATEAAARSQLEALQGAAAADAQRRANEAQEAARQAAEREARYRSELAKWVQAAARLERELSRQQLSANAARLGTLALVRQGPMQMAEVWEEGIAFQQLVARRAALVASREEVQAAQKALRKRLPPPPRASSAAASTADDTPDALSGPEFVAVDEMYKVRLSVLKREEEALRDEEERLARERLRQLRALKLSREEDASRFGRWQVLPDRPGPDGKSRYVLMNLLGKGGFSEVFKAYDLVEARPVCVKIHALTPSWPQAKKENYVRHAIREYDIHRSLRHPAVVALLDVLEIDVDTFATVLELCEGGDLDGLLREHKVLPEKEARSIMAQIFGGLRYLAARRIIHYDLKPANILFDTLGQAKITDFGLSKMVSEGETHGIELTSQGAGTYWYLPPEAFETGGSAPPRISNKLDVWSAGVIFYTLLYGRKPYGEAMSQEQMLRERIMQQQKGVDFPAKPQVSAEAKEFIRHCLAWQQEARWDVETAAQDPYLGGGSKA